LSRTGNRPAIDPTAFSELYERYKNLVYKTAYLMLGDRDEADEALQEVFVLVYRSLASYDPQKGALTTWLYRITINYCVGCRRKRQIIAGPLEGEVFTQVEEAVETRLVNLAERDEVRKAILALSEKQRAVVILRYYWNLPYADIAQILAVPLGTVKSRIDLALRTLMLKLSAAGDVQHRGSLPAVECDV